MKKILILLFIAGLIHPVFSQKNDYSIKLKIKGMKDADCFLISYFGNQRFYKDTAHFDNNGVVHFTGKKAQLESGIYGVFTGGKVLFEILVDEPVIDIETDTIHFVKNMVVKKSFENKLFLEHLLYIDKLQENTTALREKHSNQNTSEAEKKEIENQLNDIEHNIKKYRLSIIEKHPTTFVAAIFKAMKEPETDEFNKVENDSLVRVLRYNYYKKHFFDDMNFEDERLVRSPLYHNKLEKYFKSVVYPHPDSIITDVDFVIEKARANKEMFKYSVHYLINYYEKSKIMGMDAVFAHIALKYYTHEQAYWADSTTIEKVQERATKITPLLLGKKAINLTLMDTASKNWVNMYEQQADYTILIFWDPECGHCKKELPKIAEYYQTIKDKKVVVYAVSSDHNDAWKKFIRENKLDFINVAVPKDVYEDQKKATEYVLSGVTDLKSLNYSSTYDVFTTPQVYLLDKDKIFIAKKLDAELLQQVLDRELKNMK